MGGNCLKNTNTRRYQKEEHDRIRDHVLQIISSDFPNNKINALPSYRSKSDFGDCDILFESTNITIDISKYITDKFHPNEIVKNGNVYSFNVEELQIDLNLVPTINYDTSWNYYQYSSLGNLMGRIAHKLGFKFGHEGLVYVFRDGSYQFAEINVSRDPTQICLFLGYDPDVFRRGFDEREELFIFAASTPFFNKAIYAYENRNHIAQVRDRKNKDYHAFLEWIQDREGLAEYPWETLDERGVRVAKTEYLQRAFEYFPDFERRYSETVIAFLQWKKAKELFNGEVVKSVTGLENQELGNFMKWVKEQLPPREKLITMSVAEIRDWIERKYDIFKQP